MNAHGLSAKHKSYTLGRYSQFPLHWNIVSTISVIVARTSCGWSFTGATQPGRCYNPEAMRGASCLKIHHTRNVQTQRKSTAHMFDIRTAKSFLSVCQQCYFIFRSTELKGYTITTTNNNNNNNTLTVWSSDPLMTFSCMLNTAELTAFECPWNTLTEWMGGARKSHSLIWCW